MKLLVTSDSTGFSGPEHEKSLKSGRKRSLKNLKSKKRMTALEKLPTELLVRVFFFSMSLDLPRASPVIAGKLSNEYVFLQTIMMVFEPSWELHYEQLHGDRRVSIDCLHPVDPTLQVSSARLQIL